MIKYITEINKRGVFIKRILLFVIVLMCFFTSVVPENSINAATGVKKYTFDGLNYLIDTGTMTAVLQSSAAEKLTKLTVPDTITYKKKEIPVVGINEYAFFESSELKKVVLGSNVTSIGEGAFAFSPKLKTVTLPQNVQTIENAAFAGCSKLKNTGITKKTKLKKIGDGAYAGTAITSFSIPDTVKTVGSAAFNGCGKLKNIRIGKKLKSIGEGAFSGCDILESIVISAKNKYFTIQDGCIYKKSGTVLVSAAAATGELNIPEGTLEIAPYAFEDNVRVTKVVMPDSVGIVGECAFLDAEGLTGVVFGSGIKSIGENAFFGCNNLKTAEISPGAEKIDGYPFGDDDDVLVIQG